MEELQVLRTLLAPYTDEKLEELQLLIQKKQEGEISREEVEKSLRQSGLAMIADRLKGDIEKGKENSTVYTSIKTKLKGEVGMAGQKNMNTRVVGIIR
jgi:hypothetical protein